MSKCVDTRSRYPAVDTRRRFGAESRERSTHATHASQRDATTLYMTSVVEIGFGADTEKGFKTDDEAMSRYDAGPEWERATSTFFLYSAAASFVSEISLFFVTTHISFNFK